MSISALTLSLYHSKATYSTRLVLIAIANFEGEYGAYPSHETIGRLAGGLNRRTVQRAIDDLIELGELTEVRRDGVTNLYKIAIACPDECDGTTNHRKKKGGGLQTAGGLETAGRGGVQTAGGAVSRPHEPLDNPKITLRESALREDWEPNESLMAMFVTKWPDIDPAYHCEQFKLYYLSKGTKHKNWDLTFQRWMNSEQAKSKTQPWRGGSVNSTAAQSKKEAERKATEDYLAEMKALEENAPRTVPICQHGVLIARCNECMRSLE
jgi:hypothetical protein